jgi:hypothetical protein
VDFCGEDIATRFHARDEAIATHAFDLWQCSYRALHARTLADRATHVTRMRYAFDALAAWLGEEVSDVEGQQAAPVSGA